MTNVKISQLPLATSPLDSTVEMPVVQGGVTKRAPVNTIGFIQSGTGAQTRTVQAKLRDTVSVKDFGAVSATSINSAIAAAAAMGGADIVIPSGEYNIAATIDVTNSNVRLVGQGADTTHGAGTNITEKTVLKWTGSAGGTMMRFRTPYGATAQRRYGMGLSNVELSGNSSAAIGLQVDSIGGGNFTNIFVRHCTTTQYNLLSGETGVDSPAGEALDLQLCLFSRCTFDTRNTGFTATSAKGFTVDGSANSNVSGNRFEMCSGVYSDGPAFDLIRADNNIFERCSGFRVLGTGSVYTFRLDGTLAGGNIGAYANLFLQCGWDPTNGFIMGAGNPADSINVRTNLVIGFDEANGGQPPVVGADSVVPYFSKKGVMSGLSRISMTQASNSANDGFTFFQGGSRHDLYASGTDLIYAGNGFQGTFRFVGNANVISAVGAYKCDGVQVLQTRKTGWTAATGTATRTTFDTATVSTEQLAQRLKALIDDLIAHGMIGA
jgi:hypothetical protein